MARNQVVNIKVHKDYFDKIFEPNRRRFAQLNGLGDISQPKFTQAIANGIKIPKMNMSLFPKKRVRFRL